MEGHVIDIEDNSPAMCKSTLHNTPYKKIYLFVYGELFINQ